MAVPYREVAQRDEDANDHMIPSPPFSISPASSSPTAFLPRIDSTFTPLSMDSDPDSSHYKIRGGSDDGDESHELITRPADKRGFQLGGTATATAPSTSMLPQSPPSARATAPALAHDSGINSGGNDNKKYDHDRIGYDLLFTAGVDADQPEISSPRDSLFSANSLTNLRRPKPLKGTTSSVQRSTDPIEATPGIVAAAVAGNPKNPVPDKGGPTSKAQYEISTPALDTSKQGPLDADQDPANVLQPSGILRTASTKSCSLRHPVPDLDKRSPSYVTNIAQLEATAERLSMTSSIDEAIRDLHDEQKRNDSRRSSILAASVGSGRDTNSPAPISLSRQISAASSILETNSAARLGGYSPAGYVMSPNHSLRSNAARLRSGSNPLTRPDLDLDTALSRHGPGKSSTRSVRSVTKPTLMDIAEMEPTTLNVAAVNEADKLLEEPEGDDTLQMPPMEDIDLTPNAGERGMYDGGDYWDQAVAEAQLEEARQGRARTNSGSVTTFEQAERAFADFDGEHCSPDVDLHEPTFPSFQPYNPLLDQEQDELPQHELPLPQMAQTEQLPPDEPIAQPMRPKPQRPQSYMDLRTGQQMLYYPARVPMMLNLPQKLSKKPKAAVRNMRRSQVLSAMPEVNRQAASWLPEFVPERLVDPLGTGSNSDLSTPVLPGRESQLDFESPLTSPHMVEPTEARSQFQPGFEDEGHRSRASVLDIDKLEKRKSRMSAMNVEGLPPQLRASAFFDMPSESPTIQLQNGSAQDTLDSILTAAASAPVSAFTDHQFAGKLGAEVYGSDMKRKSNMKRVSTVNALETKKHSTILHLRKPSALSQKSSSSKDSRGKRNTVAGGAVLDEDADPETQRLSASIDGERVAGAVMQHEAQESDDSSDGGGFLEYIGPPTTLLAELQLRKQQQKMRTTKAFPNGMHSTLLDMDAVAETQRVTRKTRRVNLAWEDAAEADENVSDDEEVPLALLLAAKGQGQNNDMMAAIAEVNRPLGLMERKDMEDNEPLSARRDRLQGRVSAMPLRQSTLPLNASGLRSVTALANPIAQLPEHVEDDEDEAAGETLAERRKRLQEKEDAENALPRTRPVSRAFSEELMSQLGDAFKDPDEVAAEGQAKGKGKGKNAKAKQQPQQQLDPISIPVPQGDEEEETLGQRRKRLQAEREAREREINASFDKLNSNAGANRNEPRPQLQKRHSLADVLGAANAPRPENYVHSDPRLDAERARIEDEERFRRTREQKLANLRAQMPTQLNQPNTMRSGGYMAGRFNDGQGGTPGVATRGPSMQHNSMMNNGAAPAPMMGHSYTMGNMQGYGTGTVPNYGMPTGYNGYGGAMANMNGMAGMNNMNHMPGMNGYGMQMPLHMQMQMQMQQPGQQYDMVERWRQSIMP